MNDCRLQIVTHPAKNSESVFNVDDGRFLTVFKKSVRPVIPTQHSNKAHLHLKPTTAEEISKFLDDFPVTKAEQEMNIDRKRDKNTHLDYGFGDARARTVLTVPPKVIGESKYAAARESLPTFEYRDAILSAIHFNQVVVVSGETGSGKCECCPIEIDLTAKLTAKLSHR